VRWAKLDENWSFERVRSIRWSMVISEWRRNCTTSASAGSNPAFSAKRIAVDHHLRRIKPAKLTERIAVLETQESFSVSPSSFVAILSMYVVID
jgi:hypothetical protein